MESVLTDSYSYYGQGKLLDWFLTGGFFQRKHLQQDHSIDNNLEEKLA